MIMGGRGQQERSPDLAIKRPVVYAWFGPGGEAGLQVLVDETICS